MTTAPRADWEPSAALRAHLAELAGTLHAAREADPLGDPLACSAFAMGLETKRMFCYECEAAPVEIILPIRMDAHSRDLIMLGLCRACADREGALAGASS